MLNWQPQTGEMTSCHCGKERRRLWKVPSSFGFHTTLRIKLYTFNHLLSCGYPTIPILVSHLLVPLLFIIHQHHTDNTVRLSVTIRRYRQIQGSSIYYSMAVAGNHHPSLKPQAAIDPDNDGKSSDTGPDTCVYQCLYCLQH
jgi:hypothetical protein